MITVEVRLPTLDKALVQEVIIIYYEYFYYYYSAQGISDTEGEDTKK